MQWLKAKRQSKMEEKLENGVDLAVGHDEIEINDITNDEEMEMDLNIELADDLDFDLEEIESDVEMDTDSDGDDLSDENDDEDIDQPDEEENLEYTGFDMNDFAPSVSNLVNRIPEAGILSVINSTNGKRVVISPQVIDNIDNPSIVQIGYSDQAIAIGSHLGVGFTSYPLNKSGAKSIIYRTELVKQITENYDLDFTNRTSITFADVMYHKNNGHTVALISVKR